MIPSPPEALQQKRKKVRAWLKKHKRLFIGSVFFLGLCCIPLIAYGVFRLAYVGKIMPNVYVGTTYVSGLNQNQAQAYLTTQVDQYIHALPDHLSYQDTTWALPPQLISFDVPNDVRQAYRFGRTGTLVNQLKQQLALIRTAHNTPLTATLDEALARELTASISAAVTVAAKMPRLHVEKNASQAGQLAIVVEPGSDGVVFNESAWKHSLISQASLLQPISEAIALEPQVVLVTPEELDRAQARAELLLPKKLLVKHEETQHSWTLEKQALIDLIDLRGGFKQDSLESYIASLAEVVDRAPVNARFQFDESKNRVTEFSPALAGLTTNITQSSDAMQKALSSLEGPELLENEVDLMVAEAFPEISLNTVNDLGIHELLGRGVSTYTGSIPSRVHNVALAASRISGVLIKPGETFSFNANVGDITRETGYEAAYVIKNGRTELGDGGGVCQDSTTVFRAALDAGLPIVERRGHSYRVGYYEQNAKPGLDATVYSPTTDFKFLNDTPAHLLLQTIVDSPNRVLTVELYGTADGRKSEVKNYKLWDVAPPPPDVYVDDASVPAGQTKQVDWKAWGAKASFQYVVIRNGETLIDKTFTSVYKPWAAVFLKGPIQ